VRVWIATSTSHGHWMYISTRSMQRIRRRRIESWLKRGLRTCAILHSFQRRMLKE
jgi:hypothetical protein